MKNLVSRFVNDESGATAIEYGLICAFVSVVIITSLSLVGQNLDTVWTAINTALGDAAVSAGGAAATPWSLPPGQGSGGMAFASFIPVTAQESQSHVRQETVTA